MFKPNKTIDYYPPQNRLSFQNQSFFLLQNKEAKELLAGRWGAPEREAARTTCSEGGPGALPPLPTGDIKN